MLSLGAEQGQAKFGMRAPLLWVAKASFAMHGSMVLHGTDPDNPV